MRQYEIFQDNQAFLSPRSIPVTRLAIVQEIESRIEPRPTKVIASWETHAPSQMHMRVPRASDAISSVCIENKDQRRELIISLEIGAVNIYTKTVPASSQLVFDLFANPLLLCALPYNDICFSFSHNNYILHTRQEIFDHEILNSAIQQVAPLYLAPKTLAMCYNGTFYDHRSPPALLPADIPGFILSQTNPICKKVPKLRSYQWHRLLEISAGKYLFPTGVSILSSISVFNPSPNTEQLYLRPKPFRHSYKLAAASHNCFELFFQEFWRPADSEQHYFLEGPAGLDILVRAGNQLEPVQYRENVENNPIPSSFMTQDGFIYQRHDTHVQLLDILSDKSRCSETCVLAMHERVGQDSKLQQYFVKDRLAEKMLLREVFDFLWSA